MPSFSHCPAACPENLLGLPSGKGTTTMSDNTALPPPPFRGAPGYLRIATEEAFVTPEVLKLYQQLQDRSVGSGKQAHPTAQSRCL